MSEVLAGVQNFLTPGNRGLRTLPPRVPVEWVGLARYVIRRCGHETDPYIAMLRSVHGALTARAARKPSFRADACVTLANQWRDTATFGRLLPLQVTWTKQSFTITDWLLTAGAISYPVWGTDESERGCNLDRVILRADRTGVTLRTAIVANYSLHAMARFFERSPTHQRSNDDLKAAMALAIPFAGHFDPPADDREFAIPHPHGAWVGTLSIHRVQNSDLPPERVLTIRTFKNGRPNPNRRN